jgi:hypothetical protein
MREIAPGDGKPPPRPGPHRAWQLADPGPGCLSGAASQASRSRTRRRPPVRGLAYPLGAAAGSGETALRWAVPAGSGPSARLQRWPTMGPVTATAWGSGTVGPPRIAGRPPARCPGGTARRGRPPTRARQGLGGGPGGWRALASAARAHPTRRGGRQAARLGPIRARATGMSS